MVSSHGETVNLSKSIRIVPQVEVRLILFSCFPLFSKKIRTSFPQIWLQQLSEEMQETLSRLVLDAVRDSNMDPGKYPSQVSSAAPRILVTLYFRCSVSQRRFASRRMLSRWESTFKIRYFMPRTLPTIRVAKEYAEETDGFFRSYKLFRSPVNHLLQALHSQQLPKLRATLESQLDSYTSSNVNNNNSVIWILIIPIIMEYSAVRYSPTIEAEGAHSWSYSSNWCCGSIDYRQNEVFFSVMFHW